MRNEPQINREPNKIDSGESKPVSTGHKYVKDLMARLRRGGGQKLIYLRNVKFRGSICIFHHSFWKEQCKKEYRYQLKVFNQNLSRMTEKKDEKKIIAIQAAIKNMLSCSIMELKPRLTLTGWKYKAKYIMTVEELIND